MHLAAPYSRQRFTPSEKRFTGVIDHVKEEIDSLLVNVVLPQLLWSADTLSVAR